MTENWRWILIYIYDNYTYLIVAQSNLFRESLKVSVYSVIRILRTKSLSHTLQAERIFIHGKTGSKDGLLGVRYEFLLVRIIEEL